MKLPVLPLLTITVCPFTLSLVIRNKCRQRGPIDVWKSPPPNSPLDPSPWRKVLPVSFRIIPNTSTARLASTSSDPVSTNASRVVFQKVVRPCRGMPDHVFLGYLVEYLQDTYELPDGLPMVYREESNTITEALNGDERTDDNRLLIWDSSLSPDALATSMSVEVVGIFTDETDSPSLSRSIPNMAMVVVKKALTSDRAMKALPPMLQNLFADSEKRILKSLERGLDDFMSGKIQSDGKRQQIGQTKQSRNDARSSMLTELLEAEEPLSSMNQSSKPNTFIEADIESASATTSNVPISLAEKRKAALESMNPVELKNNTKSASKPAESVKELDYAVQAARKAVSKRNNEDFAVEAARKIAKARIQPEKDLDQISAFTSGRESSRILEMPAGDEKVTDPESIDLKAIRPPSLDPQATEFRKLMMTISTPQDFQKQQKIAEKAPVKQNSSIEGEAQEISTHVTGKRRLNLTTRNETKPEMSLPILDPLTNETFKDEIFQTANNALTELAEAGGEMTPEELLEDVLKFGDEKDREQRVGDGFVSGAFEKAKELLREQRDRRQRRLKEEIATRVTDDYKPLASDIREPRGVQFQEFDDQEELRRMFAAGEQIADGRIVMASRADSVEFTDEGTTQEDIDTLIASDRTISSHARILDEELAELELRINASPGEEFDGPRKNPFFDVLSGPEVYNPNVDPETVNWPGAKPGSKHVRLPQELDEAVKQASFAADILMKIQDQYTDSPPDVSRDISYNIGGRELSQKQVDELRRLVLEAIEIGIIEDPLALLAERSRLQMVLDELWNQPTERLRDVASNFKDLLLSNNFVPLIKERLNNMANLDLDALRRDDNSLEKDHSKEREILGQLVVYAQLLLKEARAVGAELEAQQLEVIRSICKVAMDPSHQSEKEASMALTDAVRDMRPLLDDSFVAYLKYAVAEEEARLARSGMLDDPEHNQWLFVLKIVQQGVYSEISRGINRYIEHIWYVLRMETPLERRMLLQKLIDALPTLDVRPFVQVVDNIVGSLGDSTRGEFNAVSELGEMTNKLLQLHRDIKELLPADRVALMSRDADEWAAKQKSRLLEQRRATKQRLTASRQTEHLDGEIESLGRRGEMERIE
ncbi:predicted protein [Phaeodactylum tricornutum CCAP 1055/1]|uniref:Uncharacterized protein n=1 Tax=Phaeodactylum tricornutum (strain CCAP 1055/1) TaxID=556484 RepID=B7GDR5_PHATC|nr:predicted protein [Phaeodactylum tricornutum CCAP 1055/1]EEC43391.1 predicted protein [Phaeodactylum tricornutum CCAP 1055/1]|eukprot:XP_002185259.1 predicted protein [Phaeodactylum tricornutum CCAP 1055/1]